MPLAHKQCVEVGAFAAMEASGLPLAVPEVQVCQPKHK